MQQSHVETFETNETTISVWEGGEAGEGQALADELKDLLKRIAVETQLIFPDAELPNMRTWIVTYDTENGRVGAVPAFPLIFGDDGTPIG